MTREEAIETLRANYPDKCYELLRNAVDIAIEALKAEPVKHGKWIKWEGDILTCSNCKRYWIQSGDQYDFRYCPNCGAKMQSTMGQLK